MNNKVISIPTKDLNWLISELKSIGVFGYNAYAPSLIKSFQKLFFSFHESEEALTGSRIYFDVFDIYKLMSFVRSHGGGLEAIRLLSSELRSENIINYFRKNYNSSLAYEVVSAIQNPSNNGIYQSALILFFNIFRCDADKDLRLLSFARDMYVQLDKEMSSRPMDDDMMKTLPSFISFFRDEEYMPLIFINHWEHILDYISKNAFSSDDNTEYVCLLSDLLIKAEKGFGKEKFNQISDLVLKISIELLSAANLENESDVNEDAVLLLCYFCTILTPRNIGLDSTRNVLVKANGYLKNHSDNLTDNYRSIIQELLAIGDPLINEMNKDVNKSSVNAGWLYPLIVNRLASLNKTAKTDYDIQVVQIITSLKNALQFIIYYQQMLVFNMLKNSSQLMSVNSDGVIDFDAATGETYQSNFHSAVKYMPSSPLAILNPLSFLSDSNIQKYAEDNFQLYMYILRMVTISNFYQLENLTEFLDKISLMDSSYIIIYNEYLRNILEISEFDTNKVLFLLDLLKHQAIDNDNKKAIVDILVKISSKDKSDNLYFAFEIMYLSNDFPDFLKQSTDGQLSNYLSQLNSLRKNKPNSCLKNLTRQMNDSNQSTYISSIWSTVDNRIRLIDSELKSRKQAAEKAIKDAEEARRIQDAEEARIAEEARLIQAFREKLEDVKLVLSLSLPEIIKVHGYKQSIDNENISLEVTLPLKEQIEKYQIIISKIKDLLISLNKLKEDAEDIALNAMLLDDGLEEPAELYADVLKQELSMKPNELKPALVKKGEEGDAIVSKINDVITYGEVIIRGLESKIQQINKQLNDELINEAREKRRAQVELEEAKKREAEQLQEKMKQEEIEETSQIVFRFVEQRRSQRPDGDVITDLDKELATLKNDFNFDLVENVTITPDEYDGPLKGVLKHIQMKRANSTTYINFSFNNYSLTGYLDANGALTLQSIPVQLAGNHMLLQSILNKIALTLIIGKDKTSEFSMKQVNSSKEIIITEKSKAHRLNSFGMLLKYHEGQYAISSDGSSIVDDKEKQREIILSADYFVRENRDNVTILTPIIAKDREALKAELQSAVELYGLENVVHISMRRNHRRRLTTKVEIPSTINVEETEVVLQKNNSIVSDATIGRYLENYQGLKDVRLQQKYISDIVMGEKNDPYLLKDDEHPLGISFGHTEVFNEKGHNRVAYTFVRDSVSVLSLAN